MIKFIILSSFFVLNAFSIEEPCTSSIISNGLLEFAQENSLPNCYNNRRLMLAQKGKTSALCKKCKDDFLARLPADETISQRPTKGQLLEKKKDYISSIAFQEYKKVITNNLLEITKLRALPPTGSDFSKARQACSVEKVRTIEGCDANLKGKLQGLSGQLAEELAQILSSKELSNRSTGLLDRKTAIKGKDCSLGYIPEKEMLFMSNRMFEKSLRPEVLEALASLPEGKFTTSKALFESLADKVPNSHEFKDYFNSHPLLGIYSENPDEFLNILKSLSPRTYEGLRKQIYSKSYGNAFDNKLAESCQQSFKKFSEIICSKQFKENDLTFNPFSHLEKLEEDPVADPSEYATSEKLISKNLNAFDHCEIADSPGAKDIEEDLKGISSLLGNELASKPLKRYNEYKYDQEINSLNDHLCSIDSNPKSCIEGTIICSIYKEYKNPSVESADYKLAKSSNSEITELLRSMIGNPTDISKESQNVLIAEGILPKNDKGEYVPQPEVAERRPDLFQQMANSSKSPAKGPATAAAQMSSSTQESKAQRTRDNEYSTNYATPVLPQNSSSDYSELVNGNNELAEINKEIMRRLSQKSSKQAQASPPPTKTEARKVARAVARERNFSLTPEQEIALANNFMASDSAFPTIANEDRATLDPGESESEKWKKEQKLRALSGMQGAQQTAAGRGIASVGSGPEESDANQEKKLSTVALNISEDKIKLNLSDVLNDKILKNDSEGQLLKVFLQNKKDFILQVNENSFRVNFHRASNSFKIQFDSGDTIEAQRIKPQLERFFNRLNTQVVRAKPLFSI